MPKFRIAGTFTTTHYYDVEASSEKEALEKINDDNDHEGVDFVGESDWNMIGDFRVIEELK